MKKSKKIIVWIDAWLIAIILILNWYNIISDKLFITLTLLFTLGSLTILNFNKK